MVPHLSKCVLIGPEIRNCALEEINTKKDRHKHLPMTIERSASMPLCYVVTNVSLDLG